MNILVLGASGFLGKNLVKKIRSENNFDQLTLFDMTHPDNDFDDDRIHFIEGVFSNSTDFDALTEGQDIIYHLISTTVPSSKKSLGQEINENVITTLSLLDSCVRNEIKRIVFISSGGTVYGKSEGVPFKEDHPLWPICSYGIQKCSIEKYLELYHHLYKLDYKVVRLANPYGPGQNPNGNVGAVTAFTYRVIKKQPITLFGDGGNVRDYIYIDDAVQGIMNIANMTESDNVINLGSGDGSSLKQVIRTVEKITNKKAIIHQEPNRAEDLRYSVLDTGKYQSLFPEHNMIGLSDGIHNLVQTWIKDGIVHE